MKIAYIGIDLFAPALEILLPEGCELLELFTCRTDNLTEFNSKVISIAQNAGVPYKLDRITIADFVRLKEKAVRQFFAPGITIRFLFSLIYLRLIFTRLFCPREEADGRCP